MSIEVVKAENVSQAITALNNFTDKISHGLAIAGDKLGQGVQYFWPILIKQQFVQGHVDIFLSAILIGLIIFSLIVIYRLFQSLKNQGNGSDLSNTLAFMGILGLVAVLVISTFVFFFTILEGISLVVNPEYGALQTIINMVKK